MNKHNLLGAQIEAEGLNIQAISEIENIYNRLFEMYDGTRDELYAITAISVAIRNYPHATKAEPCRVNIRVWDVDLSLMTTLEAEVRVAAQAINNHVIQTLQSQSDRELIWRNLLLFCYKFGTSPNDDEFLP